MSAWCGAYAGHGVGGAVTVGDEPVSYFPREYRRTVGLESHDLSHDVAGRHARLAAADRSRSIRSRLVETTENLAHAAVRHLQPRKHTTYLHQNHAQLYGRRSGVPKISFWK